MCNKSLPGWRVLHDSTGWRSSYKYSYVELFPLLRGVFDPGTFRMWARRLPQCGVASPGFLASLCATSWRRGTVVTNSSILLILLSYLKLVRHLNIIGGMWWVRVLRFQHLNFPLFYYQVSNSAETHLASWTVAYGVNTASTEIFAEHNLQNTYLSTYCLYTILGTRFASEGYIAIGHDCCRLLPLQVSRQNC
jgi:hypothetical protein